MAHTRDPVFGAIVSYRRACAALPAINERSDPAGYAAAERALFAKLAALLGTKPTTLSGAVALAKLAAEDGQDHLAGEAIEVIASARPQPAA